jgi:hypothetical protein
MNLTVQPVPRAGFGNDVDILVQEDNGTAVTNATVFFYKNYDLYSGLR